MVATATFFKVVNLIAILFLLSCSYFLCLWLASRLQTRTSSAVAVTTDWSSEYYVSHLVQVNFEAVAFYPFVE